MWARGLATAIVTVQAFHESAVITVAKINLYHCSIVLFQMIDCFVNPMGNRMKSEGNAYKEYCQHGLLK
jgi:hypothetical protein